MLPTLHNTGYRLPERQRHKNRNCYRPSVGVSKCVASISAERSHYDTTNGQIFSSIRDLTILPSTYVDGLTLTTTFSVTCLAGSLELTTLWNKWKLLHFSNLIGTEKLTPHTFNFFSFFFF